MKGPTNLEVNDWMFYLKLSKNLPEHFISLANYLSDFGIKLIPVTIDQLTTVTKNKKRFHLLAVVTNMEQNTRFKKYMSGYLRLGIINGLINLSHVSSLDKAHNLPPSYLKQGCYYFYPLPADMQDLTTQIAECFYDRKQNNKKWPGGKRGTLPNTFI